MAPQLLDWSHRMVAMYQFGVDARGRGRAAAASRDFVGLHARLRRRAPARRPSRRPHQPAHRRRERARGSSARTNSSRPAILLLNAGHEATVHAIGNGVKTILESGSIRAPPLRRRRAETRRSRSCCASIRRCISSPATRWRMSNSTACGLRKGEQIGLLLGAANRDPDRFAEPDRLRSRPRAQSACRLRRRHPFLHRRAARPARNARSRCRSCSSACRA